MIIRTEYPIINAKGAVCLDTRLTQIIISKAGGTAAKGSKTCKVALPNAWVEALGLSRENREIELAFDEDRIVLSRRLSGREFAEKKLALGHRMFCLRYYDGSRLCTILYADFTDETLLAENCVNDPVKTAFGNQPLPSWAEFQAFLRERCIPEERDGLREYLETLGLEEYDPLRLIQKTGGRMAEDQQWLEVEEISQESLSGSSKPLSDDSGERGKPEERKKRK